MNHQEGTIWTNTALQTGHRGRISLPQNKKPPLSQRRFVFVFWLCCLGGVVLNEGRNRVLAAAAGSSRSTFSRSSRRRRHTSANVRNLHSSPTVLFRYPWLLPRGGDNDDILDEDISNNNSNSSENDKEDILAKVLDVVMDDSESTTRISAGVKKVDNDNVVKDDDKDNEREEYTETQLQEMTTIITVEDDEGDEDKEEQKANVVGDDDDDSDAGAVVTQEMEKADAKATELRLEGKEYHDSGDFGKAAELFKSAADTLLAAYTSTAATQSSLSLPEDYATCRLHEALCHLKSEEYDLCVGACTDVLQDGVVVVGDDDEDEDHNEDDTEKEKIPAGKKSIVDPSNFSPAVRGRAHHRRAKAKLALGDNAGALQDARTGAFLGDGKAVGLYGKLMRESSSQDITSALNPLLGSSSAFPSPDTLLESLLQKSTATNNGGLSPLGDINPLGMLMGGNDGPAGMVGALAGGKGISGGLAKSVLSNLSKRLDDEATQETICNFLQKTNKAQLGSLASMAGMENALDDSLLDRIVGFCHGVTPRGIRRTVKATKVTAYMVKVVRRVMKLINKYKTLLVAVFILQWAKSATLRPIPISKAAKKAAKQATKQALNDALKNSR